ncbi:fused PTS fructose transporter subunit IIA/HPr protein [Candidatus Erwinia haradaeae]|uniref:Multiphosphoryl transfer protein n=1 Tax=Candidatus Erwinia haradaeae TaxID=1922217 RepID=A0A451D2H2_9GAMM|nr:fused PTS fructose transporter subunit IIA/HPr protein [Candidatus Erwinia haradaeae]VFP79827.1 Multiphosphoryl transfer protein [Candidatus Erwinia haradaeae]
MFQLTLNAITLGAQALDKQDAIHQVFAALYKAGNVKNNYIDGMLAREKQISTYIGNGIAIPHGTLETRDLILKTGVQILQFPNGIDWGEKQIAYIVIGIAAKSDEHLNILSQITHTLSDENLSSKLQTINSKEDLRNILLGVKSPSSFKFNSSLIATEVITKNIITLQALNAGLLKQAEAVDNSFIIRIIIDSPINLGQGIWLNESKHGNLISAIAISRVAIPFKIQNQTVALLVSISLIDDQPLKILNRLSHLLFSNQTHQLLTCDSDNIIKILTEDELESFEKKFTEEFIIHNTHGLHARPGAVLINVIKQFNCKVNVINLDGNGKPANGRSLIKMVALGAKKGHRLRFTAQGPESQQMLQAVREVILSGLGEEKHE